MTFVVQTVRLSYMGETRPPKVLGEFENYSDVIRLADSKGFKFENDGMDMVETKDYGLRDVYEYGHTSLFQEDNYLTCLEIIKK